MRAFWPAAEAAQADYEALRAAVLADETPDSLVAARFARRGLTGLIAWPVSEPVFLARLVGAARPPWTPSTDPRLDALAAGYELLVAPVTIAEMMEVSR
ncbi:MAG: hypothetical protein LC799_31265 [Actinobacteria bacterium]|nr:hypothetical protein [Actinomycetota bacterium]